MHSNPSLEKLIEDHNEWKRGALLESSFGENAFITTASPLVYGFGDSEKWRLYWSGPDLRSPIAELPVFCHSCDTHSYYRPSVRKYNDEDCVAWECENCGHVHSHTFTADGMKIFLMHDAFVTAKVEPGAKGALNMVRNGLDEGSSEVVKMLSGQWEKPWLDDETRDRWLSLENLERKTAKELKNMSEEELYEFYTGKKAGDRKVEEPVAPANHAEKEIRDHIASCFEMVKFAENTPKTIEDMMNEDKLRKIVTSQNVALDTIRGHLDRVVEILDSRRLYEKAEEKAEKSNGPSIDIPLNEEKNILEEMKDQRKHEIAENLSKMVENDEYKEYFTGKEIEPVVSIEKVLKEILNEMKKLNSTDTSSCEKAAIYVKDGDRWVSIGEWDNEAAAKEMAETLKSHDPGKEYVVRTCRETVD